MPKYDVDQQFKMAIIVAIVDDGRLRKTIGFQPQPILMAQIIYKAIQQKL